MAFMRTVNGAISGGVEPALTELQPVLNTDVTCNLGFVPKVVIAYQCSSTFGVLAHYWNIEAGHLYVSYQTNYEVQVDSYIGNMFKLTSNGFSFKAINNDYMGKLRVIAY